MLKRKKSSTPKQDFRQTKKRCDITTPLFPLTLADEAIAIVFSTQMVMHFEMSHYHTVMVLISPTLYPSFKP